MSKLEKFTNENFRILSYLYDLKDSKGLIKITQQEVADELKLSRVTVNKMFQQLKEDGYIKQDVTKVGRYFLMDDAIALIETFRKIEKG